MELLIVGINHKTAPVALREKVAFAPDELGQALHDLKSSEGLAEVAILSTCNRTEIYAVTGNAGQQEIAAWLSRYQGLPAESLHSSFYTLTGTASVKHLLHVAAGLDSMVLGEPQILGQVKECFARAEAHNTVGPTLHRLSQHTYRIAKKVRSSTAIGQNPVSVASIAVDLAAQLFSDVADCTTLLIGAGETIELVGKHLISAGARNLIIANRTLENAEVLAGKLGGTAITLTEIPDHLADTDIVIASTASPLPILGKGTVERALKQRRHKPIFMVDLAVPRDIEPEIANLRDVYLYSIDDLEQIIAENISNREEAAREAETIINQALNDMDAVDRSRDAVEVLVKFRQKHEAIKDIELGKALARLGKGEDPVEVLTSLANQLTNKIIHTPSVQIKQASALGKDEVIEAINHLFDMNDIEDNHK